MNSWQYLTYPKACKTEKSFEVSKLREIGFVFIEYNVEKQNDEDKQL